MVKSDHLMMNLLLRTRASSAAWCGIAVVVAALLASALVLRTGDAASPSPIALAPDGRSIPIALAPDGRSIYSDQWNGDGATALQTHPRYSSHHCVGGSDYSSGGAARYCLFHDVCHVAGEGDVLHYYVDPSLPAQPVLVDANAFLYDFGKDFVSLGVYPGFTRWWAPTVTEGPVPRTHAYHPAERTAFVEPWVESNFAEFVNVLHAVFAPQLLHGFEYSRDTLLLQPSMPNVATRPRAKFRNAMLPALSAHEPVSLPATGDVCFRNLFVGAGGLGVLHATEIVSFTAERMRDSILSYMLRNHLRRGRTHVLASLPAVTRHKIVFIRKNPAMRPAMDANGAAVDNEGSSNVMNLVLNYDDAVEDLRQAFGHVADVLPLLPDPLTLEEQVDTLLAATVIVTAPGGGSFLATFARPGTAVVFLDNWNAETAQTQRFYQSFHRGREDAWWTGMRSLHVLHYPICGPAEFPNLNIILSLPRLRRVVLLALTRAGSSHRLPSILPAMSASLHNATSQAGRVDICSL